MNLKLFRTLIGIGVCLLIAELTLLTLPQRGVLAPAGAGATQAQQVALPTGPASISGVVLRTHTRAPIESVEIQATFVGGSGGTATVLTDGSGRFTFKGIATGSYRVRAQRAGFFGPLASGGIAPMLNTQVVIQPAQPQATTEILLLEG